jgi:hypothetical protein
MGLEPRASSEEKMGTYVEVDSESLHVHLSVWGESHSIHTK